MKLSEKLQKRLQDDLGITVHLPRRIQRGAWGKMAGQWAWYARYANGYAGEVGSEDTMSECVRAKSISSYRQLNPGSQVCIVADSDPVTTKRPYAQPIAQRRSIYTDAETWAKLLKLGNGNASAGIREAVRKAGEREDGLLAEIDEAGE